MTTLDAPTRPGVITFIAILVFIKALMAAISSIASFVARGTDEAANIGLNDDNLMANGIAQGVVALVLIAIGMFLLSGAPLARLLTAISVGFSIAVNTWFMLTHHVGGYLWTGMASIAFGIFILWALYGDQRSVDYFEAHEAS